MIADTLERELAEYLAHSDYEVRFRHARTYDFFYVYVLHHGAVVAEKTFHAPFNSYRRAARWARKRVRDHENAMQTLGPLARPPA